MIKKEDVALEPVAPRKGHWVEVSEDKYRAFLNTYPRQLDVDVIGVCEPPRVAYHDFAIAKGWDAIVAMHVKPGTPLPDGTRHQGQWEIWRTEERLADAP